jgi:F-type H+-transporting ATPase subunit delta
MAELTTLARPYARAAFETARDSASLSAWSEALGLLAAVSTESAVEALVSSPNLTSSDKSQRLSEVCGDALDTQQKNFVSVLAENGRLALLPEIFELFELFKANQEKTVDVDIETAFELSDAQLAALETSLKKTLARDVALSSNVDKALLGGVFIRAGDTVIDASVRGRLSKLAAAMGA